MRLLLDENLPEALVAALRAIGHEVDSVNSLHLKGLDDSALYRTVAPAYDICFTKDAGFVNNVRHMAPFSATKLLRVALPQEPANLFVQSFLLAFQNTDWSRYGHCNDWPCQAPVPPCHPPLPHTAPPLLPLFHKRHIPGGPSHSIRRIRFHKKIKRIPRPPHP
ncbi:MAG: DUF5615 family PIN-like protein, partial [Chloroflexi bacterium]|nr:DUF5615 family PIN-like protein [Chloroflexota bacterium]